MKTDIRLRLEAIELRLNVHDAVFKLVESLRDIIARRHPELLEECLCAAPPTPRFKVGDWVRIPRIPEQSDTIGLVLSVRDASRVGNLEVLRRDDGKVDFYHESRVEPWVPREREWVMVVDAQRSVSMPFMYDRRHVSSDYHLVPAPFGSHSQDWFK